MNEYIEKINKLIIRLFAAYEKAIKESAGNQDAAVAASVNIRSVLGGEINAVLEDMKTQSTEYAEKEKLIEGFWMFTQKLSVRLNHDGAITWNDCLADLIAIAKARGGGIFTFKLTGGATRKENIKIEKIRGIPTNDIPRSLILEMLNKGGAVTANSVLSSKSRQTSMINWRGASLMASPLYEGKAVIGGVFLEKRPGDGDYLDWQVKLVESYLLITGDRITPKELRDFADKNAQNMLSAVKRLDEIDKNIIGSSKPFINILKTARMAAATDANVLLTGESGTGKEVMARFIHNNSSRKNSKLTVINCAAIPAPLFESEFFGHKRGAYTNAIETSIGCLGQAEGGSLLLDEIGDLPLALQPKVLRLLETGEYQRIGEPFARKADVRFMASTNRDIAAMVEKGGFRKDLYYRLNVVAIELPELKNRKEDIPLLVERYNSIYSVKYKKPKLEMDKETLDLLMRYEWPGNVRELQHVLEKLYVTGNKRKVAKNDIVRLISLKKPPIALKPGEALKACKGNVSQAAQLLGMSRPTFYKRLKKA
jgi:transcriptional regulator with GAF, ATPase, and Fis domain